MERTEWSAEKLIKMFERGELPTGAPIYLNLKSEGQLDRVMWMP